MKERINNFLNHFQKDTLKRSLFISFLIVLIVILISGWAITYSRLETNGRVKVNPNLAFYFVGVESQTKTMRLENVVPSETPQEYVFNISNFDEISGKKANVNLTYRVTFTTTTNLQLEYKLYEYGDPQKTNLITGSNIITDSNGVYYNQMTTSISRSLNYATRTTQSFVLSVKLPERFKNYPDELAGVIELIEIKIDSEQVVGGNNG